ncbi:MAG: hypothetical protein II956_05895 [Bacteroidales bacterium]|nr:hypothetical protein [Bacteroidales bacterium]
MGFFKILILIAFLSISCKTFGIHIDTLQRDSLLQTTGIKMLFKGGTHYKTDSKGFVIEGTPAVDTDLWTTGPLVLFSPSGVLKFNSKGKVTQGILSVNILAQCLDGRYREFQRGTRVFFTSDGLVFRGTLNESIAVTVDNQVIYSAENSPVEFYASGKIRFITPSANFKFTSAEGVKFIISANSPVKFSESGAVLSGYLAKKITFTVQKETVTMSLGQQIRFSEQGNILY